MDRATRYGSYVPVTTIGLPQLSLFYSRSPLSISSRDHSTIEPVVRRPFSAPARTPFGLSFQPIRGDPILVMNEPGNALRSLFSAIRPGNWKTQESRRCARFLRIANWLRHNGLTRRPRFPTGPSLQRCPPRHWESFL